MTAIIIIMPNPIPAPNMPPTTSHELSSTEIARNIKTVMKFDFFILEFNFEELVQCKTKQLNFDR